MGGSPPGIAILVIGGAFMSTTQVDSPRRYVLGESVSLLFALIMMGGLAAIPCGSASAGEQSSAMEAKPELPAAKQTTLGLYVTAKQAYEKWKSDPEAVKIIDVRTPEEFLFVGHPDMAWNIPVVAQTYTWDAQQKQFPMQPLPDFVARAQEVAKPGDTLLVMCRSGGRGAVAVNLLAKAGFKHVYNITDGMEGDEVDDPHSVFNGQRMVNGWKNSGLPWTYEIDPARMILPAGQ
jgi:rhodanese-related sulfurtransferase